MGSVYVVEFIELYYELQTSDRIDSVSFSLTKWAAGVFQSYAGYWLKCITDFASICKSTYESMHILIRTVIRKIQRFDLQDMWQLD